MHACAFTASVLFLEIGLKQGGREMALQRGLLKYSRKNLLVHYGIEIDKDRVQGDHCRAICIFSTFPRPHKLD